MAYIFDFGISQDDALIEKQALDIKDGDKLLCISSAGEVPLNLLALHNIKIKAVDISVNQNHLVKLKLNAVRSLEPLEAAKFLGYLDTTSEHRNKLYNKVSEFFNEEEKLFWNLNFTVIEKGPIRSARFEKYISKFNGIALMVIGKKNMLHLMELDSIEEQEEFFDNKINSFVLKNIFKIAFHPRLYKNRGIASEGLIYNKEKIISDFFFSKFKSFDPEISSLKTCLLPIQHSPNSTIIFIAKSSTQKYLPRYFFIRYPSLKLQGNFTLFKRLH